MSRSLSWACWALVGIGLLQPVGYLTGLSAIRGVGMATVASPLPLVFSHFRGIETFAADFEIEIVHGDGSTTRTRMTPELYAQLEGPYNRRNTYGAVISYGPGLTSPGEREVVRSVLFHGFCAGGPLARNIGVEGEVVEARVHIQSRTAGSDERWTLKVDCRSGGAT